MFICFETTEIPIDWFHNHPHTSFIEVLRSHMVHSFTSSMMLLLWESSGPRCSVPCTLTPSYLTLLSAWRACHLLRCCSVKMSSTPYKAFLISLISQSGGNSVFLVHLKGPFLSLSLLENLPNFFNDFSFYKYPEASPASSNFNFLLCISYWGKEVPRDWWHVQNWKGNTEKEKTQINIPINNPATHI